LKDRKSGIHIASLGAAVALGLTMLIGSAGSASAATYALRYTVWGNWVQYSQQESQWCWAAASKAMIQKKNGSSTDECTIVKNGLKATTCPNQAGSSTNIQNALTKSGLSPTAYSSPPSFQTIRNETVAGRGFVGAILWNAGGGHAMPLIGSNASKDIYVTKINTTSATGVWITYSSYIAGTGAWTNYTPSWAVGYK
jgi:hypothetical protein